MENIKEVKKVFMILAVAGVMVTAIFISVAGAANYYIDAARPDDSGDGLSWANAWKHIQKAADIVVAGDTVEVQAGTYNEGSKDGGYGTVGSVPAYPYPVADYMYPLRARVLIDSKIGTSAAPITFHANGAVIVDGDSADACFYVYNSEYIIIDGFTCVKAKNSLHAEYGNGIFLDMSSYCTIVNNICRNNNSNGICLGRVAGNNDNTINFERSRGSCNFNYILNNTCYDNGSGDTVGIWAAGIMLFGGGIGALADPGYNGYYGPYVQSNNNFLMYNYCYQNTSKGIGIIGSGDNNFIYYNILSNNYKIYIIGGGKEGVGIVIYRVMTQQLTVNNNTIVDHTKEKASGIYASETQAMVAEKITISENIIANNSIGMNEDSGKVIMTLGANNDLYNLIKNNKNFTTKDTNVPYDPLFRTTMGTSWANSYILKAKYQPDKDVNGDTITTLDGKTSPCVDRSLGVGLDIGAHQIPGPDTVATSTGTITINEAGGQVGYPEKPGNLNGYTAGQWHNTHYAVLLFDLSDPVDPADAEYVQYNYQIKYESSDFSAPDYAATDPNIESNPAVSVSTSPVLNYECQYRWRVKCLDRVNGNNVNYSTFTVANNGNIAFGLDWTPPGPVNLTTSVYVDSVTLNWTAIADSPAADPPPSPLLPPYSRQSEMASYNVYRSTFDTAGYTPEAWQAQVASLGGFSGNSGVFNIPAGIVGNPQAYDDTGLNTGVYYYAVCGIDKAGNEADPAVTPITIGPMSGGGTLIYISKDHLFSPQSFSGQGNVTNTAPCYGGDSAGPPNANSITLAVSNDINCDLNYASDAAYHLGNEHWVRHYARITTGTGAHPPEVRFYYTVGTYQAKVVTYKDSGLNANYYVNGLPYDPDDLIEIDGYTYFYADIPSDIHAAGDDPWNAAQPWGVVGVRVCGHSSYDTTPVWVNEDPSPSGYTYTYYVRNSGVNYKGPYPGERINDVRPYPLKHVSGMANNLLTNKPASTLRYFMPEGNAPVDNRTYSGGQATNGPDNRPDIFYGENPDLYVRLAYGDGDKDNSFVVFRSSTTAYDSGWINDVPLGPAAISGIDNEADDSSVSGGFADKFYGHFSFMKTPVATNLANLGANVPPEGADVMYFFDITDDGGDTKLRYAGGVTNISNVATAQANPYRYYVLQNDYSRPYIQTTASDLGELRPQDVTDSGDCSWMTFYTVKADLWDRSNGANSPNSAVYGNVINGRGNNSGVYHNPVDLGPGSAGNPAHHDTRVYYKIVSRGAPFNGAPANRDGYDTNDRYITGITANGFNYIPDDAPEGGFDSDFVTDQYTLNGNPCGYVRLNGPPDGGEWVGQIPLQAGNIDSFIYYRVYVCNDDHDPQAYNWPSENIIDGTTGAANVGNVDSLASGAALAAPYDSTSGDLDRDHGWAMYTRYGGKITGPKMIKIRAKVIIQGITKNVVAYINAEGKTLGNIIYTEIEKNQ